MESFFFFITARQKNRIKTSNNLQGLAIKLLHLLQMESTLLAQVNLVFLSLQKTTCEAVCASDSCDVSELVVFARTEVVLVQ